jgi:hypothetical protein
VNLNFPLSHWTYFRMQFNLTHSILQITMAELNWSQPRRKSVRFGFGLVKMSLLKFIQNCDSGQRLHRERKRASKRKRDRRAQFIRWKMKNTFAENERFFHLEQELGPCFRTFVSFLAFWLVSVFFSVSFIFNLYYWAFNSFWIYSLRLSYCGEPVFQLFFHIHHLIERNELIMS